MNAWIEAPLMLKLAVLAPVVLLLIVMSREERRK